MRRAAVVALAVVVVVLGAAVGYVLHVRREGRNVHGSSTVEFVPTRAARPRPLQRPSVRPRARELAWATYGADAARDRVAWGSDLRPPFRLLWTWHGRALLEFPPAVAHGRVYEVTFDGRIYALDARTGRPRWFHPTGRCGWASPAVDGQTVFLALIGHECAADVPGADGLVLALDARTGRTRWQRTIGPVESSPLVAGGLVYVGDWNGRVHALAEATGRTRWTARVGGRVKSSPALAEGRLYVGAYDGHVYALDARSGRQLWRASAQPRLGGLGAFYSTPAVAYGRVYVGSTDGRVYSFGARTGKLRWSYRTGGYVYSSPAVWRLRVLVGSYDGSFYAFDAATGEVRWRFRANGAISGSPTVLAGIVYFSTFAHRTYGLDARTGRLVFSWPDGEYSPVVTDGRRVYLTGWGRLYGLIPR